MERASNSKLGNPPIPTSSTEGDPIRWHPPKFDPELQAKVDRLVLTSPEIVRALDLAMAESAINGTKRVALKVRLDRSLAEPPIALQHQYLSRLKNAPRGSYLTYQALIMRQYWHCYDLALKPALTWFGPRKKSRFVREYVADPVGTARGYSAIDAAISYLHRRRLTQAARINSEVGLTGACDGFLHQRRCNSSGYGLLLDMVDPFKFADREELLASTLKHEITWRDFRIERDRRGSNFYYPSGSGKEILNRAGTATDQLIVFYKDLEMNLNEAYKLFSSEIKRSLDESDRLHTGYDFFAFSCRQEP